MGGGQESFDWHKRQRNASPIQVGRNGEEAPGPGDGWANGVDSETGTTLEAISSSSDIESAGSGPAEPQGQTAGDQAEEEDVAILCSKLTSIATTSTTCSSYFIEPVEWMEPVIIGCLQGKVGVAMHDNY